MSNNYVVKVENGYVKLYKSNGLYQKTICSGGQFAYISGDEVCVKMKDGKIKIYGLNGLYKRTI